MKQEEDKCSPSSQRSSAVRCPQRVKGSTYKYREDKTRSGSTGMGPDQDDEDDEEEEAGTEQWGTVR